jgi:integrase
VAALLATAHREEGNPYVVAGVRRNRDGKLSPPAPLKGLQKVWERIRERARLQDVRLHDLRHSFASVGAGAGLGLYVVGRILGHAHHATTARYAHLAEDPVRAGVERIAEEIAAKLERREGAEVRTLRSGEK